MAIYMIVIYDKAVKNNLFDYFCCILYNPNPNNLYNDQMNTLNTLINDLRFLETNPNSSPSQIDQKIQEFNRFDFSNSSNSLMQKRQDEELEEGELPSDEADEADIFKEIFFDKLAFLVINLSHLTQKSSQRVEGSQLSIVAKGWVSSYKGEKSSALMARAIYALGQLSKNKKIDGEIDGSFLSSFLMTFSYKNPSAQDISNTIYGLGIMAKENKLSGQIVLDDLQRLLSSFLKKNLNSQDISNAIYGLGLMAKEKKLNIKIPVDVLNQLLNLALNQSLKDQDISNIIYGLGLMASAEIFEGQMDHMALESLWTRLLDLNPEAQAIGNSIYGLGELVKAEKLLGQMDASGFPILLSMLLEKQSKAQAISLTLYGLGELAKGSQLGAQIIDCQLNRLLRKLLESKADAQGISNSFYGLGELAKAKCLNTQLDSQILHQSLQLFSKLNPTAQDISITIYGIGALASENLISGELDLPIFQEIMRILIKRKFLPQNIANTFYGMALLAYHKKIKGQFEASLLTSMLDMIVDHDSSEQDISNTIYSLGLLANANSLIEPFDVLPFQILLRKLSEQNPKAQGISNSIYGLGELALANQLKGQMQDGEYLTLLTMLLDRNLNNQNIANTIYGLGLLARAQVIHHQIDANLLRRLMSLFTQESLNYQDVSTCFYGLGLLAMANQLNGEMNGADLSSFMPDIQDVNLAPQSVGIMINGLSLLSLAQKLTGHFDLALFNKLLIITCEKNPKAQNIQMMIGGLGFLAKKNNLKGYLDVLPLTRLMHLLLNDESNARSFAAVINGLGILAKNGILAEQIDADLLQSLLNSFFKKNLKSGDISIVFYGLAQLVKRGQISGQIDVAVLHALLVIFLEKQGSKEDICNTVFSLGQFKRFENSLYGACDFNQAIFLLLGQLNFDDCLIKDLLQILPALAELNYQNPGHLNRLFEVLLKLPYLHPCKAIQFLEAYAKLLMNNPGLNLDIFEGIQSSLVLPFHRFDCYQQELIKRILHILPLEQKESLKIKLKFSEGPENDAPIEDFSMDYFTHDDGLSLVSGLSRIQSDLSSHPKISIFTPRFAHEEPQNHELINYDGGLIFNAIRDHNLLMIEELLAVKLPTPKSKSNWRKDETEVISYKRLSPKNTQELASKKQSADALVVYFFRHTDSKMLRKLIQSSKFNYFELILRACSKHVQYQFAKNYDLNPIILYLPESELQLMVSELLNLGFYQDHRAILNLVEALFIRKQNSKNPELMTQMQKELLHRAIVFHQQHHHRVTPRLIQSLNCIDEGDERLFNNDEAIDEESMDEISISIPINEDASTQALTREVQTRIPSHESLAPFSIFSSSSSSIQPRFKEDALQNKDGSANMRAWYSTEQLQTILSIRLKSISAVSSILLSGLDFNQEPNKNQITNQLLDFFAEYASPDSTWLILPICIHAHWVGISIYLHDDAVQLTYYDSLNDKSTYKNLVLPAAAAALGDIFEGKTLRIQDKSYYQQDDGASCGVYLIENIYKHLADVIPKKLTTEAWRERHIQVLAEKEYSPRSRQNHDDGDDSQIFKKIRVSR